VAAAAPPPPLLLLLLILLWGLSLLSVQQAVLNNMACCLEPAVVQVGHHSV
jgi:hypothetical protein